MKIDLANLSVEDLNELEAQLKSERLERADRERVTPLDDMCALAHERGFNAKIEEKNNRVIATIKATSTGSNKKTNAKYVNPENPKETCSGRGKRAAWVTAALSNGKSLEDPLAP